jgi:hypothetical protein
VLVSSVQAAELDISALSSQAQQQLKPFKMQLKQALVSGLSKGQGEAIAACQLKAPAIAREMSKDGIEVGRTSHKLRNPNNAPAEWMKPLLAQYQASAERLPAQGVKLADGRFGYVEPIYMPAMCLGCHGETISPAVSKVLLQQYPNDQATGFKEGDFRGLFWMTMPAVSF